MIMRLVGDRGSAARPVGTDGGVTSPVGVGLGLGDVGVGEGLGAVVLGLGLGDGDVSGMPVNPVNTQLNPYVPSLMGVGFEQLIPGWGATTSC